MYLSFEGIDWVFVTWVAWSGLACLAVAGVHRSLKALQRSLNELKRHKEVKDETLDQEVSSLCLQKTYDSEGPVKRSSCIFDCSRVSFDTTPSSVFVASTGVEKPTIEQNSSISTNAETDISSKSGGLFRTEASSISLDTLDEKPQFFFSESPKTPQAYPLSFACCPSANLLYAEVITEEAQRIMSEYRAKCLLPRREEVPKSSIVTLARASSFITTSSRPKQARKTLRPSSAHVIS